MARITVNTSRFQRRMDSFITKVSAASEEAVKAAGEFILAQAIAAAPDPEDEVRAVNEGQYEPVPRVLGPGEASREANRIRFMKHTTPEELYIKEALMDESVKNLIMVPRFDLRRNYGLNIAPVRILDAITKWSWRNAYGQQYQAPHGTFWAFEYGYQWTVVPKNVSGKTGAGLLSPEPGVYTDMMAKSVAARPMFTNIDKGAVIALMKSIIGEVEF